MQSLRKRFIIGAVVLLAAIVAAGCSPAYVVVPQRNEGYSARDTLYGRLKNRDIRVTFHFDTTWNVDTVTRWRTIYKNGGRVDTVIAVVYDTVMVGRGRRPDPRRRVDTVVVVVRDTIWRRDTLIINRPDRPGQRGRVDTVRVVVHDTVLVNRPDRRGRVDTVRVVVRDTVRIVVRDTVRVQEPNTPGTPGGPRIQPRPPVMGRVDTVRVTVRDTVRVTVRDTVRVTVRDTVRLPGQRLRVLHVPPGQYPPEGQCRIWIMDLAPGQQADPAACTALGTIPAGAFILFRGNAWDFDYDWLHDPTAPAEIVALKRPGNSGNSRTTTPAPTPGRPRLPTRRP